MEVGSSCRVAPRTSTRGIPASETGREKSVGASIRRPMTSSVFCLESFSRQKLLFTLETFSSTLLLLGISISDFSSNVSGFTNRIITILCILYFPFALFSIRIITTKGSPSLFENFFSSTSWKSANKLTREKIIILAKRVLTYLVVRRSFNTYRPAILKISRQRIPF